MRTPVSLSKRVYQWVTDTHSLRRKRIVKPAEIVTGNEHELARKNESKQ